MSHSKSHPRLRRFFSPQRLLPDTAVLPSSTQPNPEVVLEGQVVRHLIQVLRMQPGDELALFDGQDCFHARLLAGNKKQARLALLAPLPVQKPSPLTTHLGQAISKGERMDWVVQKATELGVTAITPLYTQQGDVRLKGEREAKKHQHWQQVAISACEQCGRTDLPVIHPPLSLGDWLAQRQEARRWVLHPDASRSTLTGTAPDSAALLIGPEGGLATAEVAQAQAAGFLPLALGPRVLRTETAPVVALSLLQACWGDLSF